MRRFAIMFVMLIAAVAGLGGCHDGYSSYGFNYSSGWRGGPYYDDYYDGTPPGYYHYRGYHYHGGGCGY